MINSVQRDKEVLERWRDSLFKGLKIIRFFKFNVFLFNRCNISMEELYDACIKNDIQFLKYNKLMRKLYFKYKGKYFFVTNYSVATIVQIFAYKSYKVPPSKLLNEYIVFDIGANKGFSSMWFAMLPSVCKVIGYEINPNLEKFINENKEMNNELFSKIKIYNFGLSDRNKKINLYSLENDDGVTTINDQFYSKYWSGKRKKKVSECEVYVRKASSEIKKHLHRYSKNKYILKIDVEGAEYEIFNDLVENRLLGQFDIIMGETHMGFDKIRKQLYKFRFRLVKLEEFSGNLNTFIAYKEKHEN